MAGGNSSGLWSLGGLTLAGAGIGGVASGAVGSAYGAGGAVAFWVLLTLVAAALNHRGAMADGHGEVGRPRSEGDDHHGLREVPGSSTGEADAPRVHQESRGGAALRKRRLRDADLSGLCFAGADARSADLSLADLSDGDWSDADLSRADLVGADLSRADLTGVRFVDADLRGAVLVDACLEGADLSRADLSGADLTGASLTGATLVGSRTSTNTRWPVSPRHPSD